MKLLKFLIGWPLSVISLLFVFKIIQPKLPALLSKLSEINLYLLFYGIVCFFIYFLLRGVLWNQILKLKGYNLSFKNTLFFWNTSELKRYTPGSIWSFLGRTVSFSNLGVKNKDILSSLLLESELIVAGTVIISLLSLGFIFSVLPDLPLESIIQQLIGTAVFILTFLFIFNPFNFPLLPKFKNIDNLKLLAISSLTFLIWGVGNYLIASSLFLLNPLNFLSYVGFFVFALLIGYLSIIVPMGLGVREGVLAFGLSKTLTLEIAGFIAIFIRIVFIISELIFLFFAWIWFKSKNKLLLKLETLVSKNIHLIIVFFLSVVYFAYMTHASFLRHDNFFTGRFDLGNMDQTVWNTIHGRIFQLTDPNGTSIVSRLSFHADFILILVSPLYLIWENPKILLLLQTFVVAAGAAFVFLISKDILKNKNASLLLAAAYLLNPVIQHPNLFDFHPVLLATTFLLAAFYFINKKKHLIGIFFLFLAGSTKEDVWAINALLGAYIFFINKKRTLGFTIFLLSIAVFYYLVWTAIPNALGAEHFALSYFSDFGDSPSNVIRNVILDPVKTLSTIFQKEQLDYLLKIFLPLGFVSFVSPLFLIFIIPNLGINLLSSNPQLHQIYYQYSAVIVPFLFISAIYGIKNLKKFAPEISTTFLAIFILLSTLYSAYQFGPLPGAKRPSTDMFIRTLENKEAIDEYLEKIPKEKSVAATNNLGSHLSRRELIYTVPLGIGRADYIVFLIRSYQDDYQSNVERQILQEVKLDKDYVKVFEDGEFVVFQKVSLLFPGLQGKSL